MVDKSCYVEVGSSMDARQLIAHLNKCVHDNEAVGRERDKIVADVAVAAVVFVTWIAGDDVLTWETYEYDNVASCYLDVRNERDIQDINNESSFHQYEYGYVEPNDRCGNNKILVIFVFVFVSLLVDWRKK